MSVCFFRVSETNVRQRSPFLPCLGATEHQSTEGVFQVYMGKHTSDCNSLGSFSVRIQKGLHTENRAFSSSSIHPSMSSDQRQLPGIINTEGSLQFKMIKLANYLHKSKISKIASWFPTVANAYTGLTGSAHGWEIFLVSGLRLLGKMGGREYT